LRIWDDNIKMDLKEKNFGFALNSATVTQGQSRTFEQIIEVFA
jgi:hypothetical protein